MKWDKDLWDEAYEDLLYGPKDEEEEEVDGFDLPFHLQQRIRRKNYEAK